jgi:flagellar hook-associated protein 2
MVDALNLNSLTVDETGRVFFSGLTSGIDFQAAVDSIIAAKRIPVDTLETRVSDNEAKITALQDLRSLLTTLKNSFADLRGAVTVGNTDDIFAAKQAFATTSRTDGVTPSAAANLLGVSVTKAATAGSHTIEILRVAAAHKVGSGTFSDQTTALGFSGSFDLTGSGGTATITLQSTDTLQDVRDRINSANIGTNATGVSASIVQVSSSEFVLVLTDDETGNTMTFANESGGVLNSLGISSDGGSTLSNELQKAQTARFTADGLTDPDRYESNFITGSTTQLSAITSDASFPASFDITVGADTVTVSGINSTDTVNDLVTTINNAITAAGAGNAVFDAGTSASLMTDGDGVRLVITNTSAAAITFTDTNGLLADLGVDNDLVIERDSITVSDLFTGVTLTLFQGEEGTTIKLDIEQDLSSVKSAVQGVVTTYNNLKTFINGHTQVDPTTGEKAADAEVLFGSRTLASVEEQLSQLLGSDVDGVSDAFSVLAQIGVTFVDNGSLSDPLLADTLEIDESTLDTALLNNADDVRKLFAFDFSSSDPRVVLLDFTGQTVFNAAGYALNVNYNELYGSTQYTTLTSFTQVDAETGGPASNGISSITYDSSVPSSVQSGDAFRYGYNSTTEELTLANLTQGTSQTIDITTTLDAAAGTPGADLGAGQSATVVFSSLGVTLTLTGDGATPFVRGTGISDGTLDVSGLDANTTMTNGAFATPTSGVDKLTVDALIAAGAYSQATGLLTLGLTSGAAGEVHFDTAAGIKFTVDGGPVQAERPRAGGHHRNRPRRRRTPQHRRLCERWKLRRAGRHPLLRFPGVHRRRQRLAHRRSRHRLVRRDLDGDQRDHAHEQLSAGPHQRRSRDPRQQQHAPGNGELSDVGQPHRSCQRHQRDRRRLGAGGEFGREFLPRGDPRHQRLPHLHRRERRQRGRAVEHYGQRQLGLLRQRRRRRRGRR